MTVEEATKKADELGLEGDVRDGFIKIRSGATTPTTPKPAPAKVAVAVVAPKAPPKPAVAPKPDKVAILAATPPETESNYDTSDASVEEYDVNPQGEPSGKVISLPQTNDLPTVQRAVAVARERPVRSPQEQAEGFRPRLSPTSAVLHAVEGSPAPAVVVTQAPVLPPGMDARRQMVADLLGMPGDSAPATSKPSKPARPAYMDAYDSADQATRDSFDALLTVPGIKPEELQIAILTPEGQAKIRRIASNKR